jgi:RAB protein geranylgeranyltransferase component A
VSGTLSTSTYSDRALAKAGKTVLHLDENDYYGSDHASLTVPELIDWCASRSSISPATCYEKAQTSRFSKATASSPVPDGRRYALSLFPAILPSRGPLIDTLIASDVSKYVSFRMLGSVSIWDPTSRKPVRVPGSKEAVFKEKRFGLLDKRRLMKFLLFAAGNFEDDEMLLGTSFLAVLGRHTLKRYHQEKKKRLSPNT